MVEPIGVGINGAGRIGALTYRALLPYEEKGLIRVVAFNDVEKNATPEGIAYYLRRDSVHRAFPAIVNYTDKHIIVNGRSIEILHEKEPANLEWAKRDAQIALEATGAFTTAKDKTKGSGYMDHITAGAKYVVISAPVGDDFAKTVVLGVNYNPSLLDKYQAISNASCTTNCLAPLVKILNQFGIVDGSVITIHAVTAEQRLVQGYHKDRRRARASDSIVPTTTGASKAIALIFPELQGKFKGAMAYRVPVLDGSVVDFNVKLERDVTSEQVNAALKATSKTSLGQGGLEGILEFLEDPTFVSSDVIGNPHSSVVDGLLTTKSDEGRIKVVSWYDNEWGYSNRTAELILSIAEHLRPRV